MVPIVIAFCVGALAGMALAAIAVYLMGSTNFDDVDA